MAGCKIVNQSVLDAIQAINDLAQSYKTAGENFIRDLNNALAEMEGETKDALKNFINNDVNTYVVEDIPKALSGMADLLEANRMNFDTLDSKIAASISGS